MSKFRSPHLEPVHVPWLGPARVVDPGEVVQVPDQMDASFLEAGWEEVRPLATKKKESD